MNRKLLALAVGSVMAMPLAAQAAPTVYGLMNLSVDRTVDTVDNGFGNGNQYAVTSNSSRLGVSAVVSACSNSVSLCSSTNNRQTRPRKR